MFSWLKYQTFKGGLYAENTGQTLTVRHFSRRLDKVKAKFVWRHNMPVRSFYNDVMSLLKLSYGMRRNLIKQNYNLGGKNLILRQNTLLTGKLSM